ncbi:unnamed protein product [Anisakis simplex]|uniref:tRNA (cytosine(34)-C(5))-methyltransferase n=1 Tax=Anisakis simplex TaxID=6269 RepID=A0A0M3JUT0_ANISI|nr:unnamed protein product [Anisakis simplex]
MVQRGIRGKKKNRDPNFQKKGVSQNYVLTELDKTNDVLFDYYKRQGLIAEEEWDSFVNCLREELPTCFRMQGCNKEAETLISLMNERYFGAMRSCGSPDVHVPEQLPWYPFAYQTKMSRTAVRSQPLLKNFHNFLVTEAELGNISRQEAVSMIPPLLLDIKGHHKVLDACAAPGSKTMQIIEMMHADSEMPTGLVVANDVDNSRCYLLVRQALKRMPTPNCVVINEDAAHMPAFVCNKDKPEALLFDRVLCDVICSGDGTFRKNPEMWRSWTPQKAIGLHKLQLNIARRCVQLLADDGLLVYSTCSLNPIEDEAIVAELLRYGNGAIELVDVSDRLAQLKRYSGVSSWKNILIHCKVFDRDLNEYKSFNEVDDKLKRAIVTSMFPPTEHEKENFHLDRCLRVLPHLQNTGGFFVAVLRKTGPLRIDTSTRFSGLTLFLSATPPITKRRKTFKEDPFVFLTTDDSRWKDIAFVYIRVFVVIYGQHALIDILCRIHRTTEPVCRNYYGISETFSYQNLLGRTNEVDKKRTLYYVNDAVKDFLECNQEKVKFINAGLRMFGRVETKFEQCRFRMSQDGVNLILPFLSKRVVGVEVADLLKILLSCEGNEIHPREELQCNSKLDGISSGSVILVIECNGYEFSHIVMHNLKAFYGVWFIVVGCGAVFSVYHNSYFSVKRAICTWMGAKTIAPYVSKEERIHLCRMLGYDTSDMENAFWSKRQSKAMRGRELAMERKNNAQRNSAETVVAGIKKTDEDCEGNGSGAEKTSNDSQEQ